MSEHQRTFQESGLANIPAPSDVLDDESGGNPFGQLHPYPARDDLIKIQALHRPPTTYTTEQASDTFGIIVVQANTVVQQQLLPVDPFRKSAIIMCFGFPIAIGELSSISNIVGQTIATVMPGVFTLPPSSLSTPALFGFEYTSKKGLYVCCATAGQIAPVQCMVERYNSGTTVA